MDISSAGVSRAAAKLGEQLKAWRTRPLDRVPYLVLDARYEKVRDGGQVVSCAVLVAIGVQSDGRRSVLGVSIALSEAEVRWRSFLPLLAERCLHGVRYVVSDNHEGLKKALDAVLPSVPWQRRCQFHLQQNAGHYVPRVAMRKEVVTAIKAVFNAPDRQEAARLLGKLCNRYRDTLPRLVAWVEKNLPEGLTVFWLPEAHCLRLRTTNGLERLNKEIKRRTWVATLFPNEGSLLRLVTAIVSEVSEDWEASRIYLNMETE